MIDILKDKKVIFFDVGYTLDYPASGNWMLTNKFYDAVGERLECISKEEFTEGFNVCVKKLLKKHKVRNMNEEYLQFVSFYTDICEYFKLGLGPDEVNQIAYDRTYNMKNYIPYTDTKMVVRELSYSYKLGIISDTWPSIEPQLDALGVNSYFSFRTYSFMIGALKPDKRMYIDALKKSGCEAQETVFIDDSLDNLKGAAAYGITPILIAANPASDVDAPFFKIHSLTELMR